jgi:hypothetical protein
LEDLRVEIVHGLDDLLARILVRLCEEGLEGPKFLAAELRLRLGLLGFEGSDGICICQLLLGVGALEGAEFGDLIGLGRIGVCGTTRGRPIVTLAEFGGGRERVVDADGRQV